LLSFASLALFAWPSDGCVAERGTHDELLAIPGGVYRGMWQRQLSDTAALAASADAGTDDGAIENAMESPAAPA
jgi:hypothetical protein